MAKTAIIVVDMLHDFIKGNLKCDRAETIVAPIAALIEAARAKEQPVIYACDRHYQGLDHELDFWGDHGIMGTEGAEIISELAPQPGDFVIEKRRYSAFFQTGLELLLKELNVDTVVLCGVQTHICVLHTATDAYYWNYHIIVPPQTTEAFDQEKYDLGFQFMEMMYDIEVRDVDSVIEAL